MLRRFVRLIVVNGAVVRVMMVRSLVVIDFVGDIPAVSRSQPTVMRSECLQGQQKQQEDAKVSTHEKVLIGKSVVIIAMVSAHIGFSLPTPMMDFRQS